MYRSRRPLADGHKIPEGFVRWCCLSCGFWSNENGCLALRNRRGRVFPGPKIAKRPLHEPLLRANCCPTARRCCLNVRKLSLSFKEKKHKPEAHAAAHSIFVEKIQASIRNRVKGDAHGGFKIIVRAVQTMRIDRAGEEVFLKDFIRFDHCRIVHRMAGHHPAFFSKGW